MEKAGTNQIHIVHEIPQAYFFAFIGLLLCGVYKNNMKKEKKNNS